MKARLSHSTVRVKMSSLTIPVHVCACADLNQSLVSLGKDLGGVFESGLLRSAFVACRPSHLPAELTRVAGYLLRCLRCSDVKLHVEGSEVRIPPRGWRSTIALNEAPCVATAKG
jgi:hypothetical protein